MHTGCTHGKTGCTPVCTSSNVHIMPRAPRQPKPKTSLYAEQHVVNVADIMHPKGANRRPVDEPRHVKKRKLAGALIALIRFKGMSMQKAWRALHPEHAHLSDPACNARCRKVLKWSDEHYPGDFADKLAQHHLGLDRIMAEVQSLLTATRYDHVLKQHVPDHRARNDGVKHLVLINGITPRTIEMVQERRLENLAPKPTIGVGPKLTKEEWDERWAKADQQSRERFKQIAAQLNEEPNVTPGTDMIVVGGGGHNPNGVL